MRHRLTSPQRPPRRGDERGASAVEFALVVPFLMLIIFGIIVYGMVFAQALSLSNSARQAARAAVVQSATCTDVTKLAKDAADTIGMDGSDTTVTIQRGDDEADATATGVCTGSAQLCANQPDDTNIYVSLTFNTQPVVPFVPVPHQISGRGVFRCEWS